MRYYSPKTYHASKSIGYLIRRARNLITNDLESLFAEKNLTLAQYIVLMYLRDNMAHTCSAIAGYLCYDSGALTRLIDQLEKRGLLKRKRSAKDRRAVKLKITKAGLKIVEPLIEAVSGYYNELLHDFSRKEADQLIGLLTRLNARLNEEAQA